MDTTLHTMVGTTDTVSSAAVTMVSDILRMVFFARTMVSIPNNVVSASEKIFLTRETIFPVARRMFSGFVTTVFVSHPMFPNTKTMVGEDDQVLGTKIFQQRSILTMVFVASTMVFVALTVLFVAAAVVFVFSTMVLAVPTTVFVVPPMVFVVPTEVFFVPTMVPDCSTTVFLVLTTVFITLTMVLVTWTAVFFVPTMVHVFSTTVFGVGKMFSILDHPFSEAERILRISEAGFSIAEKTAVSEPAVIVQLTQQITLTKGGITTENVDTRQRCKNSGCPRFP
jgi:hypothetical protein